MEKKLKSFKRNLGPCETEKSNPGGLKMSGARRDLDFQRSQSMKNRNAASPLGPARSGNRDGGAWNPCGNGHTFGICLKNTTALTPFASDIAELRSRLRSIFATSEEAVSEE
jgi:hypothetical protein